MRIIDIELIKQFALSLGIVVAFLILGKLTIFILRRYFLKVAKVTRTELDELLLKALESPIYLGIVLLGVYLSLSTLPFIPSYKAVVFKVCSLLATLLALYAGLRVVNAILEWYTTSVLPEAKTKFDLGILLTLKRVINVGIWLIAVVVILGQLGFKIAPLLAGLGIGGVAIALALQDTLSNFFSSFHIIADQPVKVGDYVQLEAGIEGFVEEIGWRTTKIKPWANNIIVIPNSKLAQSTITNYYLPQQEMSVYVPCGVSYDSDLEQVERVSKEVAKEVMNKTPGAAKDFEPAVRFKEFGDSNINLVIILRVKDFSAQYALKSEFIKALFKRYKEENIEIAYPIQSLTFRDKDLTFIREEPPPSR